MKKLFIIAEPLDHQKAGIHQYTFQLIQELERQKEDLPFEVILLRSGNNAKSFDLETIQIPNLKWIPGYRLLKLFFIIPLVCMIKRADIVFEPAHMGPFNLPNRIKRVTMIHDLTPLLFAHWHQPWSAKIQQWLLPGIAKKADLLITNSANTEHDLTKLFPNSQDKTVPIPLGINSDYFPRAVDQTILNKYDISLPYLLYVGTIEPRKNLSALLLAYEELRANRSIKHKLVIAGKKGWKSHKFYNTLSQSKFKNDILLTGFINEQDLPYIYAAADLFIYPSLYEGFGLPILEALACGTKALVYNHSSMKEFNIQGLHKVPLDASNNLSAHILNHLHTTEGVAKNELSQYNWNNYAKQFTHEIQNLTHDD